MQYRDGGFHNGEIILRACFRLAPGNADDIRKKADLFLKERIAKFPMGGKIGTAGSTFKNPPTTEASGGKLAWQLIDAAGCRGMKLGGAMISQKHANFLINTGDASAKEIEDLGENVRKIVFENFGVMLQWEIVIIGDR
jgi:UDP-N-acetylmuramate dehydrogenase